MSLRRTQAKHPARGGAALVETAIVLPIFLTFVIATFDLGLAVYRHNLVAWSAQRLGREATVHGSMAAEVNPWGTETIIWSSIGQVDSEGQASEVGEVAAPVLAHLHEPRTEVEISWPDGSNHWGDRVQVTVRSPYRPIAGYIFGGMTWDLNATCTMLIEH